MLAATISLLFASTIHAQEPNTAELYKRIVPSIATLSVRTRAGESVTGTAFLTGGKGVAATAWHVVRNASSATAKFSDGQEFEVSGVVDKDPKRDVALVRIKVAGRPGLTISETEPEVGSRAFVIGAPRGLDFTIADGLISQVRTLDGQRVIQFSCPASPGDSGGPLLSSSGTVLGVVSFGRIDGANLNFAVPGAYISGLDDTLPTQPWTDVKPVDATEDPAKVFRYEELGQPVWDGTRNPSTEHARNYWRVVLLYRDNEPAIPKNAGLGLISFYEGGREKMDTRAISIYNANRFRKMLKEYVTTGGVAELREKKNRADFPGTMFVLDGIIFRDEHLRVEFANSRGTILRKAKPYVTLFFDSGMKRGMVKSEAESLVRELDRWMAMLKSSGLDVEALGPDS